MATKYIITIGYQSIHSKTGQVTQNIKTKTKYFDSRIECERFLMHWNTSLRKILWSTVGMIEVDLFSYLNEIMDES
ncbi:unnamed protein product [marine sediment metagenome]|uniref:Uncharacterized protein n=1 Tax=marine sediment metagenome TaxID=412755 RepID=X0ZHB9_9ZZZZ